MYKKKRHPRPDGKKDCEQKGMTESGRKLNGRRDLLGARRKGLDESRGLGMEIEGKREKAGG